jgi:hypothetical protein
MEGTVVSIRDTIISYVKDYHKTALRMPKTIVLSQKEHDKLCEESSYIVGDIKTIDKIFGMTIIIGNNPVVDDTNYLSKYYESYPVDKGRFGK